MPKFTARGALKLHYANFNPYKIKMFMRKLYVNTFKVGIFIISSDFILILDYKWYSCHGVDTCSFLQLSVVVTKIFHVLQYN